MPAGSLRTVRHYVAWTLLVFTAFLALCVAVNWPISYWISGNVYVIARDTRRETEGKYRFFERSASCSVSLWPGIVRIGCNVSKRQVIGYQEDFSLTWKPYFQKTPASVLGSWRRSLMAFDADGRWSGVGKFDGQYDLGADLMLPHWFLVALLSAPAVGVLFARRRRLRKQRPGFPIVSTEGTPRR